MTENVPLNEQLSGEEQLVRAREELNLYQAELEQQNEQLRMTNESLEGMHRKYTKLFDLSPEACIASDRSGCILEANRQALTLFGCGQQELGRSIYLARFLDSGSLATFRDSLSAVWNGQENVTCEVYLNCLQGHKHFVRITSARLQARDKDVVLSVLVDLTERKAMEEDLRRKEERLRYALEAANDGMWDWRLDTNEVYYSPRYFTMLGHNPDDWPSDLSTWTKLIHPEDRDPAVEAAREAISRDKGYEIEFRMIAADGSSRHILSRGLCVERTPEGLPLRMVGTHTDITDRKNNAERLHQSEERLRAALEVAEIGTWWWNVTDNKDTRDASLNRILGLPSETTTQPVEDFVSRIHPDDREKAAAAIHEAVERCEPYLTEFRIVRPDGLSRWVRDRGQTFTDDETGQTCMTGAVADISAQRESELEQNRLIAELERKNAELERFTYSVSHDLKSPLITIKGFLGRLEKDLERGDMERVKQRMSRMNFAADKMSELLEGVLALSRLGRLVVPDKEVAIGSVAGDVRNLMRGPLQEANARMLIADNLPVVQGDQVRLREVLQNLVENALKFRRDEDQPKVLITGEANDDGTATIRVCDNGIGIAPEYHKKIFQLFEKLDAKSSGGGVGLALVKRIIEYHGGNIWIESDGEGCGTTFCFTLPLADSPVTTPLEESHEHGRRTLENSPG